MSHYDMLQWVYTKQRCADHNIVTQGPIQYKDVVLPV